MRAKAKRMMAGAAPLLGVLLMVTGCTPESGRWTPTEAPKANKVDFVTMAHEVHFAPGAATQTAAETKALAAFLNNVAFGYGDEVTVDVGPRGGTTTDEALATKRLESVTAALRRLRAHAQLATRPTVDGALSRDAVIVTVGRYVVTAPNCPDRTKPESDDFTNTTQSNFGCATATNLGLMVANPGDLVHGTVPGPADGEFATRGVQLYRAGGIPKALAPAMGSTSGGGQ
jgi:pilus assembly protein CpaD